MARAVPVVDDTGFSMPDTQKNRPLILANLE